MSVLRFLAFLLVGYWALETGFKDPVPVVLLAWIGLEHRIEALTERIRRNVLERR